MARHGCSRLLRDILTDEHDDYDIIGVAMFLVTLAFIGLGAYHLYAIHAEYAVLIARWPQNVPLPAPPVFDVQGWGMGAGALLGGHGINRFSRPLPTTTQGGEA